jgi:PadR family transcriptional regulator AphA
MERKQTAYVILGILAIHPYQSGYEIRKTIQQSVGFFWGESYGQLYPTLKRLAGEGLIEPSSSGARSGTKSSKGRQEYSITAAGQACLREWVAVPWRDDPPRDEFLLKLFFGAEGAPAVSVAHIRRFQERTRTMLATLVELEALGSARSSHYPGFRFWMMTLQFGVAQLRSGLEWSEQALAMLADAEVAGGVG